MKCLRFLAAAALALASLPASAQLYALAGVGGGGVRFTGEDFFVGGLGGITRRDDTKDTVWQLGLGYRFNPNWAVEVGGGDLGNYSFDLADSFGNRLSGTYEVKGFKTTVLGIWPASERFSAFLKLGIGSVKVENSSSFNGTAFSGDDKTNNLLAGFGIQYMILRNVGVRAEYENWGEVGNENDTGRAKLDLWTISALVTF
jgi:OOP family OmpA-OmpF porin